MSKRRRGLGHSCLALCLGALGLIGSVTQPAHAISTADFVIVPEALEADEQPTACMVVVVEHRKKNGKYIEPRQLSGDCNDKDPGTGKPGPGYPVIGIDEDGKKVVLYFEIPPGEKDPRGYCIRKAEELKQSLRKKPPAYPSWYPEKPRPNITDPSFWHNHGICIEPGRKGAIPSWFCSLTQGGAFDSVLAEACAEYGSEGIGTFDEVRCAAGIDAVSDAIVNDENGLADEAECAVDPTAGFTPLGAAVGSP